MPRWHSLEEINYRTHRKILVIDGAVGFSGGVGVADHWLGNAQDANHWRDTQLRMTGPIARDPEAGFYENFIEGETPIAPHLDDPPPAKDEEGASIIVRSSAFGREQRSRGCTLLMIAAARNTLTSPHLYS